MKTYILILFVILFTSCGKTDKINHYLNEKVTESELVNNGFYKYSYTYNYLNDENEKDSLNGKVYKYVLYSNVKPQRQKDGKLYPVPLFKYNHLEKVQLEERIRFVTDELDNRVISYLFINDILDFKSIYVYSVNKHKKDIADFTTGKGILDYYKKQKVAFKQKLGGIKYGKIEFPYRFRINNYETGIYILKFNDTISYQMVTTYETVKENEETIYDFRPINPDVMEGWYNGNTYELSK
ncbi:hypothetical protein [Flavobacterium sp.]|uniref:hypothetical protein n=1 Tax=Flavobacterium sp. TaxID=239 RepID=UPI00286DC9E2|nr:hypothetical protein [Flavobacterium sp.]